MKDDVDVCSLPAEKRAEIELKALVTCLMPRNDDELLKRVITFLFVVGWLFWTAGLGLGIVDKGGSVLWDFTMYELVSFTVIYAFARMHDLEVHRLASLVGFNTGSQEVQRRPREEREEREFVYGEGRRRSRDRDDRE